MSSNSNSQYPPPSHFAEDTDSESEDDLSDATDSESEVEYDDKSNFKQDFIDAFKQWDFPALQELADRMKREHVDQFEMYGWVKDCDDFERKYDDWTNIRDGNLEPAFDDFEDYYPEDDW